LPAWYKQIEEGTPYENFSHRHRSGSHCSCCIPVQEEQKGLVDTSTNPLNLATREDVNRLSDKIDRLQTIFITRGEHVAVTNSTAALISAVSSQVTQLAAQVEKNRENAERGSADVETRLISKLEAQKDQIDRRSHWKLGLFYSSLSSSIVAVIIIIATHFWH